jgi:DnaJ-class molecular chaperone
MSSKAGKYQKINAKIRKLGLLADDFEDLINKFIFEANFENQTTDEEYNPYQLLGINPNSTIHEVKTAFRTLVLKYHPDKHYNHGNNTKIKTIIKAYRDVSRIQRKRSLKTEAHY